jgi:hypothetical protein
MMEVNFVDFVSIVALHHTLLPSSLNLNDHLARRNVVEQKLSFLLLLDTCVINVN